MFFSGGRFRALAVASLLAALPACEKKVTGPPPRYVVVRFENLSGDPALEWVCRGVSEYLSRSLAGAMDGPVLPVAATARLAGTLGMRPASAPGISTQRSEAIIAGATRLISGLVERENGRLRLSAVEEDVASHRTVRSLAVVDSTPLKAMAQLARRFSPSAQPYLTTNADALRFYVTGLEEPPGPGFTSLRQAIGADPKFGPAWVALVNAMNLTGNKDAALDLIAKARNEKLDQYDQANIELEDATLRDDPQARIAALRQISALSPGDTVLLRSVAQAEAAAGQFEGAAGDWNKLAAVLPNDADAWNQLGYTRAWGGDYPGALAALKEYARLRPDDPNSLDSTGDVHFMYRHYAEAAASYLQASAKDPQFQKGGDLYKAAWAQFLNGDKAKADATFARFRTAREKSGVRGGTLFQADWLYRTGREKEAMALLRKDVASGQSGTDSATLWAQLTVFDLLEGDRAAAAKDVAGIGQPASPGALAVRFAALPSASAEEWSSRADKMIQGSGAGAGIRRLALGFALLLDGKKEASLPIWKQVVENTPATDFFSRAVLARLQGEQPKLALVPDPNSLNEMRAVLDKL
ncbi:MAG TPA: hypothetical protein VHB50_18265 [Bryobacteraceae bacterium]|nr:hypothetical protein [Bryobacteraceae bacterium]